MFRGRTLSCWTTACALFVSTAGATELTYSTYFGGTNDSAVEVGLGIVVDAASNVWLTGTTFSDSFPTTNAFQATRQGPSDAFLVLLDATGTNLIVATYFGGHSNDVAHALARDTNGNIFIVGETLSTNLPVTAAAVQAARRSGTDAYVAKFDATGTNLLYCTYLGGTNDDVAFAIAVEPGGSNVFIAGYTESPDFPVTNAFQTARGGSADAFLAKLDTTQSNLIYSTYLGGDAEEAAVGVVADAAGNAYVVGETVSDDFPLAQALQDSLNRQLVFPVTTDAFLTAFDPTGSNLVFSTYLGGRGNDAAHALARDTNGNLYVTGRTDSRNFPRVQALFRELNRNDSSAGVSDAFVTKIDPSGTNILFSTFLGGKYNDVGHGIAVDAAENVYVTGRARSTSFPRVNSLQSICRGCLNGFGDAFVTKFDPTGTNLLYSTFLGGSADEEAFAIAANDAGDAFVTGITTSGNFPRAHPFQLTRAGQADIFLTKLADREAHDLAVTRIRVRKRQRLAPGGSVTNLVAVEIQNRSLHTETIADASTLTNLVNLTVLTLPIGSGPCPAPVPVLHVGKPQREFPIPIRSKKKVRIYFDVVLDCVNDPATTRRGQVHDDFAYTATVDHVALPGAIADSHADDDVCPRTVTPPFEIDPYPDGTIRDSGCGRRIVGGGRDYEVTDIVSP